MSTSTSFFLCYFSKVSLSFSILFFSPSSSLFNEYVLILRQWVLFFPQYLQLLISDTSQERSCEHAIQYANSLWWLMKDCVPCQTRCTKVKGKFGWFVLHFIFSSLLFFIKTELLICIADKCYMGILNLFGFKADNKCYMKKSMHIFLSI